MVTNLRPRARVGQPVTPPASKEAAAGVEDCAPRAAARADDPGSRPAQGTRRGYQPHWLTDGYQRVTPVADPIGEHEDVGYFRCYLGADRGTLTPRHRRCRPGRQCP